MVFFGFGQGGISYRPVTAAVFQVRPHEGLEQIGRHFVVLLVGGIGGDSNRDALHHIYEFVERFQLLFV